MGRDGSLKYCLATSRKHNNCCLDLHPKAAKVCQHEPLLPQLVCSCARNLCAGEADFPSLSMSSHAPEPAGDSAARARVFQGGTYLDLHKMLGVSSGSQVLPCE